uniref:Putative ribonuclease H-like domain-containing protein n=1 Tax=Tanacetum cinerariifolium TaxID=118510 RepID=A0A6L2MDI3_TANCI|nr:putative ribonuclease H-like domain-containing protein [Tanacetum cinerariifolium]
MVEMTRTNNHNSDQNVINYITSDHPLYLYQTDHPRLILISKKLSGSNNYSSWKRSMMIALNAKNKMKMINGEFLEPSSNSIYRALWERINDMIISWILNTVAEHIAFRVFNNRTRIVEEKLHIRFNENTPNVVGSGPDWLFNIDALTRTMHYEPIVADQEKEDNVNSTNTVNAASTNGVNTVGAKTNNELPFDPEMPALEDISTFNFSIYVDYIIFGSTKKELCNTFEKMMHEKFQMSSMGELTFFLGFQVKQKQDGIFISQDKYVTEIQKKYRFTEVKNVSRPMETQKPLLKDEDGEEVDVHMYRSLIGSLMYLTSSRPDIMFAGIPSEEVSSAEYLYNGLFQIEPSAVVAVNIYQRVDGYGFVNHRVSKLKDTIRGYSIRGSILSGISLQHLFQIEPSAGMLLSGLADDSGL